MTQSEWKSVARGAGIALAGALLAYGAEVVVPMLQQSGSAALLMLSASMSVGINIGRKWIAARQLLKAQELASYGQKDAG
jgi:NAD(P)-dependent dehydrogenase (short-subunit alcohol dehydrogenase family)